MHQVIRIAIDIATVYSGIGVIIWAFMAVRRFRDFLYFRRDLPEWWTWPVTFLAYLFAWPFGVWAATR